MLNGLMALKEYSGVCITCHRDRVCRNDLSLSRQVGLTALNVEPRTRID
jgi:hypothetical protein